MPLTAKQSAFVREYAKDWNASAAAERAGLTADYGRQLLTKSHVRAAIEELRAEADSDAVMSLRELQEWWSSLIRAAQAGEESRDALRASELLGKTHGGFTDRQEHSGSMRIEVVYADSD